jgi:hypothetical protein
MYYFPVMLGGCHFVNFSAGMSISSSISTSSKTVSYDSLEPLMMFISIVV